MLKNSLIYLDAKKLCSPAELGRRGKVVWQRPKLKTWPSRIYDITKYIITNTNQVVSSMVEHQLVNLLVHGSSLCAGNLIGC